ncbi:hypothetical protein HHS_03260 [Candidatus Pantoea carbekii]|uniref:Uncharacterized protein n=1 Tax=Candidatus Pantoea carbekii TaxID=1235990 RepID=U3U2F2_9GAMM|nr:hypothetical protein HHS_03260 [Candidatus Pantoea carbekii]
MIYIFYKILFFKVFAFKIYRDNIYIDLIRFKFAVLHYLTGHFVFADVFIKTTA